MNKRENKQEEKAPQPNINSYQNGHKTTKNQINYYPAPNHSNQPQTQLEYECDQQQNNNYHIQQKIAPQINQAYSHALKYPMNQFQNAEYIDKPYQQGITPVLHRIQPGFHQIDKIQDLETQQNEKRNLQYQNTQNSTFNPENKNVEQNYSGKLIYDQPKIFYEEQQSDYNFNPNEVEDDDAVGEKRLCSDCKQPSLRYNGSEGTLVCTECGLVEDSRIINFNQNDVRNFGSDNPNQVQMQRTGVPMRPDQLNNIKTELVGGLKGRFNYGQRNIGKERRQTDPKDYYNKYFRDMESIFEIRQNVKQMALDRVDKMLQAKNNDMNLTGNREAYAVNIMHSVCTELGLNIKYSDIVKASKQRSQELGPSQIQNAHKKLNRTFPEWFSTNSKPQNLIPRCCDELKWPEELKEDALRIVLVVSEELQSCQPKTIVGVALFMLNQRLGSSRFSEYKVQEQSIADVVGKGLANIKEKWERIKTKEHLILPDEWLCEQEKHAKKNNQATFVKQTNYYRRNDGDGDSGQYKMPSYVKE